MTTIRRLNPGDAVEVARLRRESLEAEPMSFGASIGDDAPGTVEALRESLGHRDVLAILGAFDEGRTLVGMVGVTRSTRAKRHHKAMLWGMYVAPQSRRRGIGRLLVERAISQAREWPGVTQLLLSVTTGAPDARRLYLGTGFRPWGLEPRGIQWEGQTEDEEHFVFELQDESTVKRGGRLS